MDNTEPLLSDPPKNNRKKYLIALYAICAIGILGWGISFLVRWMNRPSGDTLKSPLLRASFYTEQAKTIKIFEKHPSKTNTNIIDCTGDYCRYMPKNILCAELNDVSENSPDAVWECSGKCFEDYELDTVSVSCSGIDLGPRSGCILHITMRGPWTGWSDTEMILYFLFLFLFVLGVFFILL